MPDGRGVRVYILVRQATVLQSVSVPGRTLLATEAFFIWAIKTTPNGPADPIYTFDYGDETVTATRRGTQELPSA